MLMGALQPQELVDRVRISTGVDSATACASCGLLGPSFASSGFDANWASCRFSNSLRV